jgi:hypothetical protein
MARNDFIFRDKHPSIPGVKARFQSEFALVIRSKGKAESENTYVFMASFRFVIFLIFFLSFFVS